MKKICFYFQKGGVGKSACSILIARLLSANQRSVILIDGDPQANTSEWAINEIHEESALEAAYRQLHQHNLYTLMHNRSTLEQCLIPVRDNLSLLGCTTEYERAKSDFRDVPGKDLLMRHQLSGIEEHAEFLILDTPGEISDLSNWALSVVDTVVIPVGTQLLPVESLGITLQRIEQAQRYLNPDLKTIYLVPNQHKRRNTAKVALRMLEEQYGGLLARNAEGSAVVLHDRAEIEALIMGHQMLPTSSKAYAECQSLVKVLA